MLNLSDKSFTDIIQSNMSIVYSSSHKALIQQLPRRQTFECWWQYSSDRCLSCMLVWFELDYRCWLMTKDIALRGCSLLPDGRMVFSSSSSNIVRFISKYGVQLFQIVKDKTGIFFRSVSILYVSLVWIRLSLLTNDCKQVSCVSTSFSICFTAVNQNLVRWLLSEEKLNKPRWW
jgi:hypothetical protein